MYVKSPMQTKRAMSRALFLAHKCAETGDVPVGAIVVDSQGRVVGEGWNQREAHSDPTAHAEIVALRDAGRNLGDWNLSGCTLIVTLEPCTMCAGAIVLSRVDTVVFGAWDEKAGACGSVRDVVRDSRLNHQVQVIGGVMEEEASIQLKGFFAQKRMKDEKLQSSFWQRAGGPAPVVSVPAPAAPVGSSATPKPAGAGQVPQPPRRRRTATPEPQSSVPALPAAPVAPVGPVPPAPPQGRRSDRHKDRVIVPPLQMD